MDVAQLTSQLEQAIKLNEQLREENASLQEEIKRLRDQNVALQEESNRLRRDHEALLSSAQTLMGDRDKLDQRVAELEVVNQRLVDMLWGRRSERRPVAPDQLWLGFADDPEPDHDPAVIMAEEQADQALDAQRLREAEARRRRRKQKRRQTQEFPAHLERRERVLDLSEEEKRDLTRIGEAVSERMRFEKPHVYIERIVRPKYVAKGQPDRGVLAVPPPLAIVEGCKYDFSVIASIVAQKFAFHLPTYRQQDWFAQCGWSPSRSTLNDLINVSAETVTPLFDQMWQLLLEQDVLLSDDTRLLVLTRGALSEEQRASLQSRSSGTPGDDPREVDDQGSVTSYAWLYTSLDGLAPYNVFHWSLTHGYSVVDEHLESFRGTLVGDAFGGYAQIEDRSEGRIVHASCNAHARREFVKAEASEPILSAQALSLFAQLYDVEERGTRLDATARLALRQREAVPIWMRFGQWLESPKVRDVLPRSPLGKAVGYVRNQWTALQRYLSDGRLPIDNNQSEREIRVLPVGRKNWLFLGHPRAGPGRLRLVSVVSSAMRHHLKVDDYLEDVLIKLADAAQHRPCDLQLGSSYLFELLPDHWALAHPQSVRHSRIEEKKQVYQTKRARRRHRRRAAASR